MVRYIIIISIEIHNTHLPLNYILLVINNMSGSINYKSNR